MKALLILLMSAGALLAQTPRPVTSATLDESEVRITYGELKRLVAATLPKETPEPPKPPPPPITAALLSALYDLNAKAGALTAEMQVENFDGGWHAIPLAGATMGATAVEPKDARLVVADGHICLITDKAGAQQVKLSFALAAPGQGTVLHLAPAPIAALTFNELPDGKNMRLQQGANTLSLSAPGKVALPSQGGEVTLSIEDSRKPVQPAAASGTDDAIISEATYNTEVVRDGSVLTEGAVLVRHDHTTRLELKLPESAKLLQCHVNGEPVRPVVKDAVRLEIPLDDPATDGAESEVKFSFTAMLPPLQTAEGELELALPQTPLFAKQIDWNVQLPTAYELSFSGNVDPVSEKTTATGLHLRKSLCRDQQPQARITYRKRSSN
ncbi:hypothetical protein [Prosthecobacter vanneervenii]|uniref:Uncharacterized protein n=1 Tax=Prosthecobacter vanneervenii TaxID=48466 RepID=A0A7W8DJC9_9BACT|nr:hypothetical protein [Prosthecobacter vanneervenii]MBB5032013.1 hypothetical protein [Prosthecobacter vanneervenii]